MTNARKGFFFDLDGTLADSLPALWCAYELFLGRFGVAPTREEFDALNGPSIHELPLLLRDRHAGVRGDDLDLRAAYVDCVSSAYASVAYAKGATELLHQLRADGWVVGLVTANLPAVATRWLEQHQLTALFDVVVGTEEGRRGKPEPDLYVCALEASACSPGRALALEDSLNGLRAAERAGIRAVRYDPEAPAPGWSGSLATVTRMSEVYALLADPRLTVHEER